MLSSTLSHLGREEAEAVVVESVASTDRTELAKQYLKALGGHDGLEVDWMHVLPSAFNAKRSLCCK